jgi:hypothetical protein
VQSRNGFRCHDIYSYNKLHKDWFRHLQAHSMAISKAYFNFLKARKSGSREQLPLTSSEIQNLHSFNCVDKIMTHGAHCNFYSSRFINKIDSCKEFNFPKPDEIQPKFRRNTLAPTSWPKIMLSNKAACNR